eukprot:jgi/Ulvmu1/10203/UM060_0003.1
MAIGDQSTNSFHHESSCASEAQQRRALQLLSERKALPVWSARKALVERINNSSTVILIGETGSGKTTQAPQLVKLQANLKGMIACTQPRRIAAMTVAQRVADEQGVVLGTSVGFAVRFNNKSGSNTKIKYMTDGLLIREAISDPELHAYSVVFVDEAHERTVNTDVLLGLLKYAQQARHDSADPLKLIIMSATLDFDIFLRFYPGSIPAYVQGRQYDVKVFHTAKPVESYLKAAVDTVLQVHLEEEPGHILVFLSGQDEIELASSTLHRAADNLNHPDNLKLTAVPMYAALSPDEQAQAFAAVPSDTRKVILATNIAETSVTIPGVRYVIDSGMVKARAYSAARCMESLQVVPASKAQCRQRSGRAGRESPGKCFRLFPEAVFHKLPDAPVPEIQRSNLSSVVLQLKALGVEDVLTFDFMDPPPRSALKTALSSLYALQAMDSTGNLTKLGRKMAHLPLGPPLAAILLAGGELNCVQQAVDVVSLMSTDRVFITPANKESDASAAHKKFRSALGDHVALLMVFRSFLAVSPTKRVAWCRRNFVNHKALRHADRIKQQLLGHLKELGLDMTVCEDTEDYLMLRRAVLKGLFQNTARRQPDGRYRMYSTSQEVFLHPGSVLMTIPAASRPACVVFNEVVLTNKAYAHVATAVDPAWLPELVPHFFARKIMGGT